VKAKPFDPKSHRQHMAIVLGLAIAPDWEEGVDANLAVVTRMATALDAFPIDDRIEPAFVFEADR
jgi:hypothetical protein